MKITKAQLRRIVRESYLPAAPPTSQLKPFVKKGNYLTPGFKNAQGDFMMIGMYTFYGENDVEWIVRNEDVELGLEALHRWKKPSQKIWAHTTHFEKPDLKNVVPRSTLERIIANDDAKRAGQPFLSIESKIVREQIEENPDSNRVPLSIETLLDIDDRTGVTLFKIFPDRVEEVSSDPEAIMSMLVARFGVFLEIDERSGRVYRDGWRRTNYAVRNI
jgi:hypothetical protein